MQRATLIRVRAAISGECAHARHRQIFRVRFIAAARLYEIGVCFILFIVCIKKKKSSRTRVPFSLSRARTENRDDDLRSVSHFSQEVHAGLQLHAVIVRANWNYLSLRRIDLSLRV